MHPLERWFAASLGMVFRGSLVLTLALTAVLASVDAGLHCASAPQGIVSFELAGSEAPAVLGGWSEAQRRDAIFVQGLDYLYLSAYATALASAALLLGRRAKDRVTWVARLATPIAWAQTIAGVADAGENAPMIVALRHGVTDDAGATIALVCASIKFALVAIGLVFLIAASVATRGGAR